MSNRILVLGSTGKTGKRVYSKLKDRGVDVTPASRNSEIPFDWYNQSSWAEVLKNKDNVYVTFQPDLAIPHSLPIITEFVKAAKQAKVKKIVLLSGRGEFEAQACEEVVIKSGLVYTIVRASFFMQNFSEGVWLDSILGGELVVPFVKAKEPFVDVDDIADVVVKALLDDALSGKVYELTGPELLSFKDTAAKISGQLNKEVKVTEVELVEYAAILRTYNLPEDFISLITYLFEELLDGRNESVKGDIETVLKRQATSFDYYVAKTAATGIWSSTAN